MPRSSTRGSHIRDRDSGFGIRTPTVPNPESRIPDPESRFRKHRRRVRRQRSRVRALSQGRLVRDRAGRPDECRRRRFESDRRLHAKPQKLSRLQPYASSGHISAIGGKCIGAKRFRFFGVFGDEPHAPRPDSIERAYDLLLLRDLRKTRPADATRSSPNTSSLLLGFQPTSSETDTPCLSAKKTKAAVSVLLSTSLRCLSVPNLHRLGANL